MNILRLVGVTTPDETPALRLTRLEEEERMASDAVLEAFSAVREAQEEHEAARRHLGLVRAELARARAEVER